MKGELPVFKRCCFCLPLRRGLVGWGYLRLALDILAMIRIAFICIYMSSRPSLYSEMLMYIAVAVYYFIDAFFAMFLIVGGHKKSHKLLRISYIYCIVWLALILILEGFVIYRDIYWIQRKENMYLNSLLNYVMGWCMCLAIILVQLYLILLTRSEEIKLREENLGVQFVNNAADAESICVCADNYPNGV